MRYLEKYNIYEVLKTREYGRKLNPNKLQDYLDRFCKDFSWDDAPIYRGINKTDEVPLGPVMLFDPKAIDRESANTKNYYTLLFDNSPYRNGYPKRSKSLICSNEIYGAGGYGKVYRVIPFDGAKIGVCNSTDFWNSFPKLEDLGLDSLDDFNNTISFLYEILTDKKLQEKYHVLIRQIEEMIPLLNNLTEREFDEKRKEGPKDSKYNYWLNWSWSQIKKFQPQSLDEIFQLLDPIKNGIDLLDYNEYKLKAKNTPEYELWTDSKAIFVSLEHEKKLKNNEILTEI